MDEEYKVKLEETDLDTLIDTTNKLKAEMDSKDFMDSVQISTLTGGVPLEIEDSLFFLYINGMSFSDIAKKFENTPTPFSRAQLYRFAHKRRWNERKETMLKEVKEDFSDVMRLSQAKKMTAISMAVQAVSDMIIRDVEDLKRDSEGFWREIRNMERPRPFWMAKNVDELTSLYKLQQLLEVNEAEETNDGNLAEQDRATLLRALADAQKMPPVEANVELLEDPSVIDIEDEEDEND